MLLARFTALSPFQRSLASAAAGFVFYGGWAFLVNSMHGSMVAIKAACVQGGYSFTLTFCMTVLVESLFRLISKLSTTPVIVNWATIIITCTIVFSSSWLINTMAGTPEIFKTVILGYIIGSIYSATYVYGLARAKQITAKGFNI